MDNLSHVRICFSSIKYYFNLYLLMSQGFVDSILEYLNYALYQVQRAVASAMVAFLSTANNMTASGTVSSAPEPLSAGEATTKVHW